MKITKCQVNHLTNPLGYSFGTPVFHWVVEDSRGTRQTEARIVVRCGDEILHDTGSVLMFMVSFTTEGRRGFAMYRNHEGKVQQLERLDSLPGKGDYRDENSLRRGKRSFVHRYEVL